MRSLKLVRADQLTLPKPVTRLYRQAREVGLVDEHGRDDYRVSLDRCRTSATLLAWLLHLSEKEEWVTVRHLGELIEHAERENGIAVQRGM